MAVWFKGKPQPVPACQWFSATQDWRAAFEQALLAEEYETAVSLLQYLSFEDLFEDQTVVLLLRLHEQQSQELTLMTPQLIGLVTGALLFAGRFEQAGQCMAQMARFAPQPSAVEQRQLLARWQALRLGDDALGVLVAQQNIGNLCHGDHSLSVDR